MSPAPQDSVPCKATGRSSCLGGVNLVREMIPAAVVESRPRARGWYCAEHGRAEMDRRARQATFFEAQERCSMCGDRLRPVNARRLTIPGPHPVELFFCRPYCEARWLRTQS